MYQCQTAETKLPRLFARLSLPCLSHMISPSPRPSASLTASLTASTSFLRGRVHPAVICMPSGAKLITVTPRDHSHTLQAGRSDRGASFQLGQKTGKAIEYLSLKFASVCFFSFTHFIFPLFRCSHCGLTLSPLKHVPIKIPSLTELLLGGGLIMHSWNHRNYTSGLCTSFQWL